MDNNYKKNKILVADDNPETAKYVKQVLESGGYRNVKTVSNIKSFKKLEGYDIVILDIVWPSNARPEHEISDNFGFAGLRYLKTTDPKNIVILMSSHLFDLNQHERIAEADAFFKSSAEGSQIIEKISKVLLDKSNKLLNILEETLLDGRADLFGLKNYDYNNLLNEVKQVKIAIQNGEPESSLANKLNKLLPWATGSNTLLSIINGIIKLFSGG
jgi:CheY-like chemotaxis protein